MSLSHREIVGEMLDNALEYAAGHNVPPDDVRFVFDILLANEYRKHLKVLLALAEIGDAEAPTGWASDFVQQCAEGEKQLISREDCEEALKYFREKVRFLNEAEQEDL